MKNIQIIKHSNINNYIYHLWSTEEFKEMHLNHPFFICMLSQLEKYPLFFYDLSNDKQKYHLTSIFNFIPNRQYTNLYIQDLYYFHELVHCCHYQKNLFLNDNFNYHNWKQKLSENELFASLFSEAFIYLMNPKLQKNTFPNLWINNFINLEILYNNNIYNNFFSDYSFDLLNLYKNNLIPNEFVIFNSIINRRLYLRTLSVNSKEFYDLNQNEQQIVKYNKNHINWLEKWEKNYIKLENLMQNLINNNLSEKKFLNIVLDKNNLDIYDRPFLFDNYI